MWKYYCLATFFAVVLPTTAMGAAATYDFIQVGSKLVGRNYTLKPSQGYSVAISSDGTTLMVGGPGDDYTVGAIWAFHKNSTGYFNQQGNKLVGNDIFGEGILGIAVALNGNGDVAIAGAPSDNSNFGSVVVFTRDASGTWSQQGSKHSANDTAGAPLQGYSVSISSDGKTFIYGGPQDNSNVGAAWVFTQDSKGSWTQQGDKLVGSGYNETAQLQGKSVSLSADGNTALIGGPSANNGVGGAWIFVRDVTTMLWSQKGNILEGISTTGAMGSFQGNLVALSGDGNTALTCGFGSYNSDLAGVVFIKDDKGDFVQLANPLVVTGFVNTALGSAASINFDGTVLVIGAANDNMGIGAVWIFTQDTTGYYSQKGSKLVGSGYNSAPSQGSSAAMSGDGNTVVVGGSGDAGFVGATWVFTNADAITDSPTKSPTKKPLLPSKRPTSKVPSKSPTKKPSHSTFPTRKPTSKVPSKSPTKKPSQSSFPTGKPTSKVPSKSPTKKPLPPTGKPTSKVPSKSPTKKPSESKSPSVTKSPVVSNAPSPVPTQLEPTNVPSVVTTTFPTLSPNSKNPKSDPPTASPGDSGSSNLASTWSICWAFILLGFLF